MKAKLLRELSNHEKQQALRVVQNERNDVFTHLINMFLNELCFQRTNARANSEYSRTFFVLSKHHFLYINIKIPGTICVLYLGTNEYIIQIMSYNITILYPIHD